MDLISLVGIGISAFIATNIDDIFVLMIFFSNSTFQKCQIVVGQFLGIGLLVALSTLGALLSLVIPQSLIGLLGLINIVSISLIFMVMTAVWCIVAYYLVNYPVIAKRIRNIGNIIFPFVLIGLGTFILISNVLY